MTKAKNTEPETMIDITAPEDTRSIHARILAARKNFGDVVKASTNPFHKSKYADLNSYLHSVSDALAAEGVMLAQPIYTRMFGEKLYTIVSTQLRTEDGDCLSSELAIPENPDPQKVGAAITYYRRYTLGSLLALGAEDDDAESAKDTPPAPSFKKPEDFTVASVKELKDYLEKNSAKMPKKESAALKARFDELKAEYLKNKPEQQEKK